jgi:imidazolonepropionase-like amidohydrolase
VPIVAHCHGGPWARWLIEFGVDVIEHGSYLTDPELDALVERGIWLDMTLGILVHPASEARQGLGDSLDRVIEDTRATLRRAIEKGVRIVLGTDTMHGLLAVEAKQAAELGLVKARVVRCLTWDAAQALGKAAEFGALKPGLAADIIALDGDPLQRAAALERVALVMARGTVVRAPR